MGERAHEHVARTFAYQAPKGDQPQRYAAITEAARVFSTVLADNCPDSPELTLALRDVEMARMRANQSIAVNEVER